VTNAPTTPAGAPRVNRLLYASHSFGSSVLSRATQAWLIFFLAPPADEDAETIVPRLTLTTILLVLGVLDAIDDPLIGYWSDRTRSRWGRRAPFIIAATPFYALLFFLFWTPPDGHAAAAAYIALIIFAQRIAGTLSGGPMEALLPEIARTPASRVENVGWQFVFGSLGAVVGLVATGLIKDAYGFVAMGAIVAIIAVLSRYLGLFGVWRYLRRDVEPVRVGFRDSLVAAFRNSQFRAFLPTFVFFNSAVLLLIAALPFYADVIILGDDERRTFHIAGATLELGEGGVASVLFGATIVSVLAALPYVLRLAMRIGKARVYGAAMLCGAALFPSLAFMGLVPGVGALPQSLVFVAIAGLPMAGVFTFPNAILADIIDYDDVRTGVRREALYYGAQNVLEKWTGSLVYPIFALLLLLGETPDDALGIRLAGPVAGIAALLGYLSFRGYWLPDDVTPKSVAANDPRDGSRRRPSAGD
jgi:GPH family glycoside/pentoside/hexuronide:cation symporter